LTQVAGHSPTVHPVPKASPDPGAGRGKHPLRPAWYRVATFPFRYIRSGRSWLRRGLRTVLVVFVIMLLPTGWSYTSAMLAAGSAPLSAKTVEWVARHGGRGLVTMAETWWLDHHKPAVGGSPAGGIPTVAPGPTLAPTARPKMLPDHLAEPPDVAPIVANPLPHEGVWQPLGQRQRGVPTMYVSYFRPDTVHTSLVSAVVWMDQKLLSARLVPGVQDPGGQGWSWIGDVPPKARADLVAAFNSGFYIRDSKGGYYSEGRTAAPLRSGAASLVIYKNGTATVGSWGSEVSMSPDVMSVRQNLSLIVDQGKPVKSLTANDSSTWGATYGNTVLAWRSAVGVTQDGALLFGCGDGLSAVSLADIMVRAGAVRAMEMDINHVWVTFESFKPAPGTPYGALGTNILDGMWVHPERFLQVDERDFFAMFLRPDSQLQEVAVSRHVRGARRKSADQPARP
jgi:hypothetical protein